MPRFLLALTALFMLGGLAQARFEWRDVVQDVQIQADGRVLVTEERTLWTDEDFGEAFICIGHGAGVRVQLVVAESGAVSPGPQASAYQQRCSAGTEVVVRNDTRVKERRVRFVYWLEGTVEHYSDVVQWYWNMEQLDHPPIVGYRLRVTAPGPMTEPFDAYVHRYANLDEPVVSLSADGRVLDVSFRRIPDGDGVEIRWLMDPVLFEQRGTAPAFLRLLEDEADVAGLHERSRLWRAIRNHRAWGLLPLALLGVIGFGVRRSYLSVGREPATDGMLYRFEPPSELPPAAVTMLMHQDSSSSKALGGRAWFATIMDLARRGYLRFEGTDKRNLAIILEPEAQRDALLPMESDVLRYLRSAQSSRSVRSRTSTDPQRMDLKQLTAYGQTHAQPFLLKWAPKVRSWLEEMMGGPLTTEASRAAASKWYLRLLLPLIVLIVGSIALDGWARAFMIVGAVGVVGLYIVVGSVMPAWRPEVGREHAAWLSFKRTLTDHTRMKDAPPNFFVLWDRYFCYAAALGVAERYLKTLQQVAPARNLDQSALIHQARWMGAANASSLSNMSSAINSLSSALASAGASASSGGSSSGGGGGGGGGGSSGGR